MILSLFYQSTVILFSFITLFSILPFMTFSSMIKMTHFYISHSFIVHFSILFFRFFTSSFSKYALFHTRECPILFPDLISEQVFFSQFPLNLLVSSPLLSILFGRLLCDILNNVLFSVFPLLHCTFIH